MLHESMMDSRIRICNSYPVLLGSSWSDCGSIFHWKAEYLFEPRSLNWLFIQLVNFVCRFQEWNALQRKMNNVEPGYNMVKVLHWRILSSLISTFHSETEMEIGSVILYVYWDAPYYLLCTNACVHLVSDSDLCCTPDFRCAIIWFCFWTPNALSVPDCVPVKFKSFPVHIESLWHFEHLGHACCLSLSLAGLDTGPEHFINTSYHVHWSQVTCLMAVAPVPADLDDEARWLEASARIVMFFCENVEDCCYNGLCIDHIAACLACRWLNSPCG